jgi:hypothetical protein
MVLPNELDILRDRSALGREENENRLGTRRIGCYRTLSNRQPRRASDSFWGSTLEDTKLYFTAPLRWDEEDWLYFGGALVAIGAAHSFDERVRDHFATGSKAVLNGGEDKNSLRDAAPTIALIAGTGLYASFIDDRDGYRETWA